MQRVTRLANHGRSLKRNMSLMAADEGAMSTKVYHGVNIGILVSVMIDRGVTPHESPRLLIARIQCTTFNLTQMLFLLSRRS